MFGWLVGRLFSTDGKDKLGVSSKVGRVRGWGVGVGGYIWVG